MEGESASNQYLQMRWMFRSVKYEFGCFWNVAASHISVGYREKVNDFINESLSLKEKERLDLEFYKV